MQRARTIRHAGTELAAVELPLAHPDIQQRRVVRACAIFIGDRDVTDLSPKDRDVAMVFQNYALYPHMTVADNMGFALRLAGKSKAELLFTYKGMIETPAAAVLAESLATKFSLSKGSVFDWGLWKSYDYLNGVGELLICDPPDPNGPIAKHDAARALLDLPEGPVTPPELIRAVLAARVDLLWNGARDIATDVPRVCFFPLGLVGAAGAAGRLVGIWRTRS